MNKNIILLLLIISLTLVFSCQRNEGVSRGANIETIEENVPAAAALTNTGYALVVNTWLYTLVDGEDTGDETTRVTGAMQLTLGERLLAGEPRRLTWAGNNTVLNFIEVSRHNGDRGFALATQVAVGGRLAVVIDERANLHGTARTVDVSGIVLTRRSIVIYYPETEENGFVEVRGWDIGRQAFVNPNNCFVRLSSLSRRDSDIQAAIHLQIALSLTADRDANRRDALLESALLDYSDSVFYQEIFEIRHPNTSGIIEDNWF